VTDFVLDASALVALIRKETGWEEVEHCIPSSLISAVNYSETIYILRRRGMPLEAVRAALSPLITSPAIFDGELAYITASIVESTRGQGISFADCACLALAQFTGATAVTAERRWDQVALDVTIKRIR
jgi:PIN domain nuclease of toxin-antitoxin system